MFPRSIGKICQWPVDFNDGRNNVQVDEIMVFCLGLSLMFDTDFVKLDNPQSANTVQLKYLKLLYRYLKSKYDIDIANSKFHEGIMIGSVMTVVDFHTVADKIQYIFASK